MLEKSSATVKVDMAIVVAMCGEGAHKVMEHTIAQVLPSADDCCTLQALQSRLEGLKEGMVYMMACETVQDDLNDIISLVSMVQAGKTMDARRLKTNEFLGKVVI